MKKSILVGAMVVFFVGLPKAKATISFDDGGHHTIDYTIPESVHVLYNTRLDVISNGSIHGNLEGFHNSIVNVSGGLIHGDMWAKGYSEITISAGSIGNYFGAVDNSQVTISDGSFGWVFGATESSQVNVLGGTFSSNFFAEGDSQVNFSGGTVLKSMLARINGHVTLSGGNIEGSIYAGTNWGPEDPYHTSVITIYGIDFQINGESVPYGQYFMSDYPSGHITGVLLNGSELDNDFYICDGSSIVLVRQSSASLVADADGPYTIYVGDTLTLDASGSTDDDNDIVSYMWDLDDNDTFETDAGDQEIFDVNYTYLESLGLLVNNTYNIHLQVTDSEDQNDINDTTLTILPKPAIEVAVDIKPGSCPNPLNVRSKGVLPVAILGSEEFDVYEADIASIRLAGVAPIRSNYEDVATPVEDGEECECTTEGPDGYMDLTLKFDTQEIVATLGEVNHKDELSFTLEGALFEELGGTPIRGADCILVRGKYKPPKIKQHNKADINGDGVVDFRDFNILSEQWLKSNRNK